MRKNLIFTIIFVIFINCGTTPIAINKTVKNYRIGSNQIVLGDSLEKVMSVFEPLQNRLAQQFLKPSEQYITEDGKHIYIYYVRSGWTSDGLTTDDEFTPYMFENKKLISIGWQALGGEKSHGKVVPRTHIQQNTTVIDKD